MLIKENSNAFSIINDFSRQLFLINTPSDFSKSLQNAFGKVLKGVELYVFFRYHWDIDAFSIISSNYLHDIDNIPLERQQLEKLLKGFIKDDKNIYNDNLAKQRSGDFLKLFNTANTGSEVLLPLIPVNDAVGILYVYSRKENFFDGQQLEIIKLIGNMTSRAWNLINYQAHQIKSHKKAELEVINQKNLMNEIFDYLPINIFTKDEQGHYLYVNKNAEESLGMKLSDITGKTVFDIYPKETAAQLHADDQEVRTHKTPKISQLEIKVKGRTRHIFAGKKLISTNDNREFLIGFSIDITQNIQTSRAIEEQKKFYQQIFNTVPNYIYVKDRKGKFLLVNDAFSQLFQLTQDQILRKGIIDQSSYQIDEALNNQVEQDVLKYNKTIEFEESILLKNGEKRWYHTTKKPLPAEDGTINVLGLSVDITDRKKHSDELIKAKQTKEQFLANMSHEIRTPINGIVGMVNLLEEIPATEEQKKYLQAIKNSSKNLQVIINDILDLSAVESGNIKFEKIGINIKSLFSTLISSFSYTAKQKGLTLSLNMDPYIDDVVIGDPVRLNQVVSNLIGNAVKFTKRGYVKVYALKLGEENGIGHFQFIVDDSGIGIPEENLKKVFENFEQGNAAINRKYGGTGLGLAIVKQLVEAQKGTIEVQSRPSRGTKFIVDLHFKIGKPEDIEETKTGYSFNRNGDRNFDLSRYNILLVEDNEVNILYTRKILQKWNCNADEAKNGLESLEMLKQKDYDLILMDVRMPVMDGFEATKFIRSNFQPPKSNIPIIALTANAIKGDSDKCIEAGMNDYISKPFQPDTLKNKIVSNMDMEGFTKKVIEKPAQSQPVGKTIDLTYLREMSDNDLNFITDMVKSFIEQSPRDIENIWFHFENNELDEVANLIHKMKPSITFMGIHPLKEMVLEMEENARKKEHAVLKNQLTVFRDICYLAIDELKQEFHNLA